jgi:glc operon protein GlcG
MKLLLQSAVAVISSLFAAAAMAQAPAPSYGPDVTVDVAKKIAAATLAECQKNSWRVAVAIVNTHGSLIYFERMEDTQTSSTRISQDKARAAAMYRRTTRVMTEGINKGNPAFATLPHVIGSPGGVPIVVGGKIIGAVGVSGVTGDQDEQCAKAGVGSL